MQHQHLAYLENKVKTLPQLLQICQEQKKHNKIIVSNNGCYDILHLGHVLSLLEAKEQGDILIVGINSDASVKANKGPQRPINNEHTRQCLVAALACVDYVFLFNETTPLEWLKLLKPQVHTNAAEYGDDCIEKEVVSEYGGRIHLLTPVSGFSTSNIIKQVQESSAG